VFKVALGLVAFAWKPWLGGLFLAAYALYVWRELKGEGVEDESCAGIEVEPLKLRPRTEHPATSWAVLQTVVALAVIWVASQVFVHQLETVGPWLGLLPRLGARLLRPP